MINLLNQFNAAMELSVIVMMMALFLACILKKEKKVHQNLLVGIIGLDIMALACDFGLWMSLGNSEMIKNIKILWALNYLFAYILIILFHYYLLTLISEKVKVPKTLYYIAIPLALIVTAIYFSSFYNGIFFVISNSGEYIHGEFNWANQLIRISLLLVDVVITIIYSKSLGIKQTLLLLLYETVPIASFFFENKYRLGIIYIAVSVLILIEYISVSVEQDVLLAKQKQRMAEQEKKLTVEKTKIMISQIQPHFLYNVISSIMSFCREDPEKAVDALADFSDYLRTNMHSLSLETPVSFKKELEHVKRYVKLEKFRFADRLNIEYDIGTTDFFLPSLTLQPLVENAVKHGIGQRPDGGKIVLKTSLENDGVKITVSDDGVGFDTNDFELQNTAEHIGIANVRSRLMAMCSGTLTVQSIPDSGTLVTVFLPFENQI